MIPIDRSAVARPDVLDLENPSSAGAKETKKAIDHFTNPADNPKPSFSAYSHDSVKEALIELFHLKCAYCETRVTSARDIEHFRPKGRIDPGGGADPISPGYYWLAATWENLLLSCPDCNQRKRALERDEHGEIVFADESTGKLDQFPLSDESKRLTSHAQDEADEEPFRLLLNPCRDPVGKHIRFDTEGNVIARQVQGETSPMAIASIEVYVLYRPMLVEARKAKYLDMVKHLDSVRLVGQVLGSVDASQRDLLAAVLDKAEADLEAMTDPDQEFVGMVKRQIRPMLREIEGVRSELEDRFGAP